MNTAAAPLPGMPSEISGISEPPTLALIEHSEAIRPVTDPLPNFSSRLLNLRSSVCAMNGVSTGPTAGRMPSRMPIVEERR